MPDPISGGVITAENFDELVRLSRSALVHTIEHGETPEFVGKPMTSAKAVEYLEGFMDDNRLAIIEGGHDFLASLVRRLAVTDGPDETGEAFEEALVALSDEQLVALSEADADQIEEIKRGIIDRRRKIVASAVATGKVLLRGALASGLQALLAASTGGAGPVVGALLGGALAGAAPPENAAADPGAGGGAPPDAQD